AESQDTDDTVRASAVAVLSKMQGENAKAAFRKFLADSDETLCIFALNAVLAGRLDEYADSVEDLLNNSEPPIIHIKAKQVFFELIKKN
ncbi:hypothetical protein KY317_03805, partial [Candidatus Woesearchaeota archaeon]|nr:hypothetical protein [Candidatus Woesearchaeota archaeon]